MEKVGLMTTIPVEVIFASGNAPVDLNNIFVNAPDANQLIITAEEDGLPRNYCSWVKGVYAAAKSVGIRKIIAVREGECTNSEKITDILEQYGIMPILFSYPQTKEKSRVKSEIENLMAVFNVSWKEVNKTKYKIDQVRRKLFYLDELSFSKYTIAGFENYLWLISSTDFEGNVQNYEEKLDLFLKEVEARPDNKYKGSVKIGLIGIPPIINNLFTTIETLNGVVVYNEMPRQFCMTHYDEGLVEQLMNFTYPYNIKYRVQDIQKEIGRRRLDGIIHYVQSFCPRQIDDITLRNEISIPYITIECDRPGVIDERNVTRLEAFFERWN